jgi:transcriptional regulator GlxA family with amidase domain
MIRIPKVTMTMRELDRLKCIQGLIDGQLKQHAVATRLGMTTRQVRRLVRQYEQQGPVGLISKLRNRPSNRRLKSAVAGTRVRDSKVNVRGFWTNIGG